VATRAPDRPDQHDSDRPSETSVVPMRRRHLRAVLRIEAQVYPKPWSLSLFLSELALRGSRSYYVARRAGVVVGYGGLMFTGEDAHVTTLAVDPAFHRQRIGTRLLATLAHDARRSGARNLTLEVRMGNAAAQSLYAKFGFRSAGVRKNYYIETNEDALVMWSEDIDTPDYASRLDALDPGAVASVEWGRPRR
jgi:ribosomal-protein-alanine N-acetyltransferase